MCGMCGPCSPKVDTEYVVRQWNALPRAKELERKVDDELAVIFGGVRTQGSLL